MLSIHPPVPSPTPRSVGGDHTIFFRHPGYPADFGKDFLIELRAYDHPDGGLHHETARIACAIVAGNAWNGYLSTSAEGLPIGTGLDDLLSVGTDYWFHVPHPPGTADADLSAPYLYPICPTFDNWQFPHRRLPPTWLPPFQPTGSEQTNDVVAPAQSNLTMAVTLRDQSCRVSNYRDGTQSAHLCPRKEETWFRQNGMGVYNLNQYLSGPYQMDDLRNVLLLRRDLHSLFDEGKFAFVPKPAYAALQEQTTNTMTTANYVTHFLSPTYNIGALYHNTSLQFVPGVKREFLLARFAWAIFPSLTTFLNHGSDRLLVYVKTMMADGRSNEPVSVVEMVSARECAGFTDPGQRSRSGSPRKRKVHENEESMGDEGISIGSIGDIDLACTDGRVSEAVDNNPAPDRLINQTPLLYTNYDDDANSAADTTLLNIFGPSILREVRTATDDLWETITAYPGHRRVSQLRENWLRKQRPVGFQQPWEKRSGSGREREVGSLNWMREMGVEVLSDGELNG